MLTTRLDLLALPADHDNTTGLPAHLSLMVGGVWWAGQHLPNPHDDLRTNFDRWFLPWGWPRVLALQLFRLDAGGNLIALPAEAFEFLPARLDGYDGSLKALRKHHSDSIRARVLSGDKLLETPLVDGDQPQGDVEVGEDDYKPAPAITHFLRGYIARRATELPPYNVGLGLDFFCRLGHQIPDDWWVPAANQADPPTLSLVAFPVFDGNYAQSGWQPTPKAPQWSGNEKVAKALYPARAVGESDTGTDLAVVCERVVIKRPSEHAEETRNPQAIIRMQADGGMSNLRLVLPTPSDTANWMPGFSERVAQAFDLPLLLLAYLKNVRPQLDEIAKDGAQKTKDAAHDFLNRARDFIIHVTRDLASFGVVRVAAEKDLLLKGPAGWSFIQEIALEIARKLNPESPQPDPTALLKAAADFENTPPGDFRKRWVEFLADEDLQIDVEDEGETDPRKEVVWRSMASVTPITLETYFAAAEDFLNTLRLPEIVAKLAKVQWTKVPGVGGAVVEELPRVFENEPDPARLLAEGLVGLHWLELIQLQNARSPEQTIEEAILKRLALILVGEDGYWRHRCDPAGAHPESKLLPQVGTNPFPAAPQLGELDSIENFRRFTDEWLGLVASPLPSLRDLLFPNERKIYPAPPPIRLQIDQIAGDSGDGDLHDELAGIILFVRETTPAEGEWRSLNAANAVLVGDTTDQRLVDRLLGPSPVGEDDGARTSFREVSNEHSTIIARPPKESAPTTPTATAPTLEMEARDLRRIDLEFPEEHRCPRFFYGREYEFAGGAITNAGMLPECLRAADLAGADVLITPAWQGEHWQPGQLGSTAYRHLRRVSIGPVRLENQAGKRLPPIPAGVRPLACELPEWETPGARLGDPDLPPSADQNLLLLLPTETTPAASVFCVRRPTTDFWNWFAWIADSQPATTRDEWDLDGAVRRGERAPSPPDDPAVTDELYVEVEQMFPLRQIEWTGTLSYPDGNKTRAGRIEVKTSTVAPTKPLTVRPSENLRALTIELPAGTVVRLRLRSQVPVAEFHSATGRFHDWMLPKDTNGDFARFSPIEVWLEAARPWSKDLRETLQTELWNGLRGEEDRQIGGTVYEGVSLSLDCSKAWQAFAQVGSIEVLQQVWRWDGREVPGWNASSTGVPGGFAAFIEEPQAERNQPESASAKWDGVAFATRPDFVHRTSENHLHALRGPFVDASTDLTTQRLHTVSFTGPSDRPEDNQTLPTGSGSRPRDQDPRAYYLRFAVRAHSRYEPQRPAEPVLGVVNASTERLPVWQPWWRFVRKARATRRLPKPTVRFALPLTRDTHTTAVVSEQFPGASILLMLDDIWFGEAGLADDLEIAVRVLTEPKPPGQEGARYPNAGFDPTLSTQALKNLFTQHREFLPLADCVSGPYGLTYDFGVASPKLKGTSFALRLPAECLALPAGTDGQLPWFLCEIALRRKLREAACADCVKFDDFTSEWTAPFWVQFLPNCQLLLPVTKGACGNNVPVALDFEEQSNPLSMALEIPLFDLQFEQQMERWVILSEEISDIKGHPVERYLATFVGERIENSERMRFTLRDGTIPNTTNPTKRRGYLRVLLVRRHPSGAPSTEPWRQLLRRADETPETERAGEVEIPKDASVGMPVVSPRLSVSF